MECGIFANAKKINNILLHSNTMEFLNGFLSSESSWPQSFIGGILHIS